MTTTTAIPTTTAAPQATAAPTATATSPSAVLTLRWAATDAGAVAWRNALNLLRNPSVVVLATFQPVIFVLMFRYVFGGALGTAVPGVRYVDFLMAGIFVQTVTFGSMNTGVGLAVDVQSGLIERFRSLPMARSAVLVGRILADMLRNVLVIALMIGVGFAVGFRLHTSVPALVAAGVLLLFFGAALSWVMALLGLVTGTAEGAQAGAFPLLALLVFPSGAFIPTNTMPGWLQVYANNQPVTATADATRALVLGGPTTGPVLTAAAWTAGIAVVFGVLAVRRYRRVS